MLSGKLIQGLMVSSFLCVPIAYAQNADRSGKILPIPDAEFEGVIGETYADSKQAFPQAVVPPENAPNVVLILIDDLGFGQPGTFGGPVPTPSMDALAAEGLRFTRFHTTAVCSPTRAALLTGRNHHQVGFGSLADLATGYPGYNSVWPRTTASIAEILKGHGYSTAAFGKWHNTPEWEMTPIGPFDRWPTGLGFEYFFGFQGGETSQWDPQLFRGTVPVEASKTAAEGYNLNVDLVDDAIGWLDQKYAVAPDRPYFLYFAPGAVHAPLHVSEDWIEKFDGQFDQGWDVVREQTLERQIATGIVPEGTILTPRPAEIDAWDSQTDDAKRLYARHQEVFAGFLAQTDYEIGRLLDAIRAKPGSENTLIILIAGDNGPSAEGTLTGTTNNTATLNGLPETVEAQLPLLDEIGGPELDNHYPVGWAWAGASPFQWMKRVPSHFGGTRNGMVISWPDRIVETGGIREQFHHVIDIAPTILNAIGIQEPEMVNGVEQVPMAGVGLNYSFTDGSAPGQRETQYFETGGHRAIYHDGWVATSFHGVPWELTGSLGFEDNVWQLYNIEEDFSQAKDVSGDHPEILASLQEMFDEEAKKFGVYPLDDRFIERGANPDRPSLREGRAVFSYGPGTKRIPDAVAAPIYQTSHVITADIEVPEQGANGVILANGGPSGGYVLYLDDGVPVYEYSFFAKEHYKVVAPNALQPGRHSVVVAYEQLPFDETKEIGSAIVRLSVNGEELATGKVEQIVPSRFAPTETMDIGADLGGTVSEAYRADSPFAFTGNIDKVTIELLD